MAEGIEVRHAKDCRSRTGARCNCQPSFRASVWSQRDGKKIKKTFPTESAAKAWRQDALVGLRKGTMRARTPTTIREACDALLAGMRDGSLRTQAGTPYKPSVIRSYESTIRLYVIPRIGGHRLSDVRHEDLQDLVDALLAEGKTPAVARGTISPLRTIYTRAVKRGVVAVNPTKGIELPAETGKRDRIADPAEAEVLLAALVAHNPAKQRNRHGQRRLHAFFATAIYAGLRAGELLGLRWEDVDLAAGTISVERAWDPVSKQVIDVKSRAGRRTVPMIGALRDILLDHRMGLARDGRDHGYVFGVTPEQPIAYTTIMHGAYHAFQKAGVKRITPHECRHTFASLMIAAGVNAKALSTYIGHANISETFDRYGHLMPGNEAEAAGLLEDYLRKAAHERARLAQIDAPEDLS